LALHTKQQQWLSAEERKLFMQENRIGSISAFNNCKPTGLADKMAVHTATIQHENN
jgi:hypothetical protein